MIGIINIAQPIVLSSSGGIGFFLLFAVIFFLVLKLNPTFKGLFDNGYSPRDVYHTYREKSKLRIYEYIGGEMIRKDVADMAPQLRYMRSYLQRVFPGIEVKSMRDIYNMQLVYEEREGFLNWMRRKLTYSEKIQFLDYLIDLAFHNHVFTKREASYLHLISTRIGIPLVETKAMMRIRYERLKAAEEAQRRSQQQRNDSVRRPNSAKHTALKILGLDTTATLEDVRKAYRQLARVHHPDKFARGSDEDKRMAHERFTEISKAHDYLVSYFGS